MPKQLQTVVRQGRKVLANLWLKEILTTRDTCFFFQPPSLDGEQTLDMKQKFSKQLGMTWRHVRPKVSQHYLRESPYRELQNLMQGPVMIAYPREAEDRQISTKTVLALAKEFNLGLMGAKWRNTFLSAQELRELKGEAVYRGEVLALFANYQREVVQALNLHHEKETGTGGEAAQEGGEAKAEAAAAGGEPAK
jgi:hypothetical protein